MPATGSLYCVGTGITFGAHITKEVEHIIQQAEIVYALASDPLYEQWLMTLNPHVESLQSRYQVGKSRRATYHDISQLLITQAQEGQHVVAAFYGHPCMFVTPAKQAVITLQAQGITAKLVPGISAADCLYADLKIDPLTFGCLHLETSQFLLYEHHIDSSNYLILWQPMFAGDTTLTKRESTREYLHILKEQLAKFHPIDHEIIVYEAASNALRETRIEKYSLYTLPDIDLTQISTIIVPPSVKPTRNRHVTEQLSRVSKLKLI